ncbi:late expression factor 1 [Orgyia leucostigma nucleopolyhedrovirus]|uniref:Late expression factor 1 n=1 Tax=Orgyia leucostigma nucleopolyhedrovirus TaxID=490711 RepID=B0FE00_9ABAC|nr:late expression factor 1 [Orgyia leucostigma nucleopolyhedrovirus]ABY65858.1 late expression factor 1 [Orgyia leucostigma nucleopolyhedrovirus]
MSLLNTSSHTLKYTVQQALRMWNAIAYNDCREYVFYDGARWQHHRGCFSNFDDFYKYLVQNNVSDVHVKALPNNGGREWVVDVDFKEDNKQLLEVKILVAQQTFINFFGDNVARIMHSGNRGVHVWLKINNFRMSADKQLRRKYYKAFIKPKVIDLQKIVPGSFIYCVKSALECQEINAKVKQVYDKNCVQEQLNDFWPAVDEHVFCNLNQIRAPFSFNYKGKKFSSQLH